MKENVEMTRTLVAIAQNLDVRCGSRVAKKFKVLGLDECDIVNIIGAPWLATDVLQRPGRHASVAVKDDTYFRVSIRNGQQVLESHILLFLAVSLLLDYFFRRIREVSLADYKSPSQILPLTLGVLWYCASQIKLPPELEHMAADPIRGSPHAQCIVGAEAI